MNALSIGRYVDVEISKDLKDSLTATILRKKPGLYVAHCPTLDVYSQGRTRKEAEKNIIEAVGLFIESCIERNTLGIVLKECGF